MKVDWKWLTRMARNWSETSKDFPVEEQAAYRRSLGLPLTPPFEQKQEGDMALDCATKKWFKKWFKK